MQSVKNIVETELKNTITHYYSNNQDSDIERVDQGQQLVGLVKLKNIIIESKKYNKVEPGYGMVFRSKNNPKAFLYHRCTSKFGRKSNLYKALRSMTGGRLKEDCTSDEAFTILKDMIGKWFYISVEHNGNYSNIIENQIIPAQGLGLPDCRDFFSAGEKTQRIEEDLREEGIDTTKFNNVGTPFDDDDIPF